jgi:hypothetical protein
LGRGGRRWGGMIIFRGVVGWMGRLHTLFFERGGFLWWI